LKHIKEKEMGIFEQMGFTDPKEMLLKESIKGLEHGGDAVSGFFLIQLVNSVISGSLNIEAANKLSQESLKYMEEKKNRQVEMTRERHQAEIDFMREYHQLCLIHQIETSRIIYENRKTLTEFEMFCNNIWKPLFRPNIDTLMKEHEIIQPNIEEVDMKVMLARTPLIESYFSDCVNLEGNYNTFCKNLGYDYLRGCGLSTSWLAAWKQTCKSIGAETMNMFYVMQGLPCVLLFPYEKDDGIIIESSTWGLSVGLGNLVMERAMIIEKKELKQDPSLLYDALLSICIYTSDCYRALLCQKEPIGIKKVNNLLAKSNSISDWLRNKYQNLAILTQNKNFSIDNKNTQIIKKYIQ